MTSEQQRLSDRDVVWVFRSPSATQPWIRSHGNGSAVVTSHRRSDCIDVTPSIVTVSLPITNRVFVRNTSQLRRVASHRSWLLDRYTLSRQPATDECHSHSSPLRRPPSMNIHNEEQSYDGPPVGVATSLKFNAVIRAMWLGCPAWVPVSVMCDVIWRGLWVSDAAVTSER